MKALVRSWSRVASGIVAVVLALGAGPAAQAQTCPVNAACTPGNASNPQAALFGMGILNVTVGNSLINSSSGNYSEGYRNQSCNLNAPLLVAQSYPISVRTGPNAPENVRVWIDYNNDGAFTGNSELVFSEDNRTLHTGTFTPPATATLGTRLRLRVSADFANGVVPTSCSTPQYSQVEDYSVTLSANSSPPAAAFTTNGTTTCTGCVQFTDASQNVPTAWFWTFGDGATSTLQNPNHCYTAAGTYPVTLRATNAAGASTSAVTSITYNTAVPVAASCTPQTINYFANYGIVRFRLGTIDNTSADGSAGYQNFTCPQRTELTAGVTYAMTITTGGANAHDIRVFLDANNDGVLAAAEQLYQGLNVPTPGATAFITLPVGTVLNQPLRLRVVADAVGNSPGPCSNQTSGQAEDYTVIVRPNTSPPVVSFTTNYVPGTCVNPIRFTDTSQNVPTFWLWDFGDGTTSTLQNPSHTYAATGSYTVSLTAGNAFGSASVSRLNAVAVQVPCLIYCASNGSGGTGPGGQQQASPFWIASVAVTTGQPFYINNTVNAAGGYGNHLSPAIVVGAGGVVNIIVNTNLAVVHRTSVWVDANVNGVFDANELFATGISQSGSGSANFTARFTVPSSAAGLNTRMRIQVAANQNPSFACGVNILNAEVEDYQLRVQPLATREAQALPSLALFPNPTADGLLHLRLPDARAAGLYATEVQNLLGATVLRTSLRLGPAADAELDLRALAPGVYVLRLRDAQGLTALRRVVRQ